MDKSTPFENIDFAHIFNFFQVLFTVQQIRVRWALSVRKSAS